MSGSINQIKSQMEKSKLRDYVETVAIIFFLPAVLLFTTIMLLLLSHWRVTGLYAKHVAWWLVAVSLVTGLAVWLCHVSDANSKDEIMLGFAGVIALVAGVLAVTIGATYWWVASGAIPFLLAGIFFRINESKLG